MSTTNKGAGRRRFAGRHLAGVILALAVAASATAITVPGASASLPGDGGSKPCTSQTFGKSTTYRSCVQDLQVLLNDLRNAYLNHETGLLNFGPDRILGTDGVYGNNTWSDVHATNATCATLFGWPCVPKASYTDNGTATTATWEYVCLEMSASGLDRGSTYYLRAGCEYV